MSDLYQEIILEEARQPQNVGQLEDADYVIHDLNASCGDEVTIYLKLDSKTKKIAAVKWQGQGCVISQAAMSLLSAHLMAHHITLDQIQLLSHRDLSEWLGINDISPGRLKCLLLGLNALKRKLP
ncbi:MAG TPA: iron-sulfur cluster assembly scaffold protein [Vitreimonas sp.]|nr:iron-sulfur cluster assembly scaffold protein [Vitreimonas sp.]